MTGSPANPLASHPTADNRSKASAHNTRWSHAAPARPNRASSDRQDHPNLTAAVMGLFRRQVPRLPRNGDEAERQRYEMIAQDLEPGEEPLYRAAVTRLDAETLRPIGKAFAYLTNRYFHFVRMTVAGDSIDRAPLAELHLAAEDEGRVMLVFKSPEGTYASAAFQVDPASMTTEFALGAQVIYEQITGRPFSNP